MFTGVLGLDLGLSAPDPKFFLWRPLDPGFKETAMKNIAQICLEVGPSGGLCGDPLLSAAM